VPPGIVVLVPGLYSVAQANPDLEEANKDAGGYQYSPTCVPSTVGVSSQPTASSRPL